MRLNLFRDKNGRFSEGIHYSPETQFKLGERRSIKTEFKQGQEPHNKLHVGTIRIRRETHTGLMRAWVKISEPNVWKKRAVLVWESVHGPLPKGLVVHHCNRNSLDDSIKNLQGMSRRDHVNEHREELEEAKRCIS